MTYSSRSKRGRDLEEAHLADLFTYVVATGVEDRRLRGQI